jgi:Transposase DDE domain
MLTSKSPMDVAMVALAAGKEAFSDYSHIYSPQKFTQPQLFACLVLKEFEKKDYRGICQLLLDCSALAAAIGLSSVPHYTTLQKASRRLLRQDRVRVLLKETVERIRRKSKRVEHAAVDSSGFDARHASRYFIWRRDNQQKDEKRRKKRVRYRRHGKLMVIVCCATHAILAAVASAGPTPDIDQLDGVMNQLPRSQTLVRMVADAGFDSAHNHHLLREEHGIRSTIPPEYGRPPKNPLALPGDKYRRLMKTRFNAKAYRHRAQVETVISMLKRNLGSALRARSHWGRCRDLMLRAITHNVALALSRVFYRAGQKPILVPSLNDGFCPSFDKKIFKNPPIPKNTSKTFTFWTQL